MSKIILLNDIYELRQRKQQELEFYHQELAKLKVKLMFTQKEIDLTTVIIDMIEGETVLDMKQLIQDKKDK
jgi:hypothetical protein